MRPGRPAGLGRRGRRAAEPDPRRLPHRRDVRHGRHHRGRPRARCPDAVGPVPLGRRRAGRPDRRPAPTSRSGAPTSTSTADPAPPPSSGWRRSTRPPRGSRSPAGWGTGHRSRWRATTSRSTGSARSPRAPRRCSRSRRSRRRSRRSTASRSPTCARRSLELTDLFISLVEERLPGVFEIVTPREHERRGSQVSLRHDAGVRRRPGPDRPRGHRRLPRPRHRPLRLRPALQHPRRRADSPSSASSR